MELVLIIEPSKMNVHKYQTIFRRLFKNHKCSEPKVINSFLSDNNIEFENELGVDEYNNTILTYKVNGINLFGVKY